MLYNVLTTGRNADGSGGPGWFYDVYDADFRAVAAVGRQSATVPGQLVFSLPGVGGEEIMRTQTPVFFHL